MLEPSHRFRQLRFAQPVHLGAKGSQDRDRGQTREPLPVFLDLRRDHFLHRGHLVAPALDVRRRHHAQVVEIVEKDVAERPDIRIDISRNGNVENAERAITALLE